MFFKSVYSKEADSSLLKAEYRNCNSFGILRLGETNLFFRKFLSVYYIPYSNIQKYFRRVHVIEAAGQKINVESLVIFADNREVCDIQLPGAASVNPVMALLKEKMPDTPSEYVKEEATVG